MEGKDYISAFKGDIPAPPDYDSIADAAELRRCVEQNLIGKIALLYGQNEIHTLGGQPPGEAVRRARAGIDAQNNQRIIEVELARAAADALAGGNMPLFAGQPLTKAQLAALDTTADMDFNELTREISAARSLRNDTLVAYSDSILDWALKKVDGIGARRVVREKDVIAAVREAIGSGRLFFNELIGNERGIITTSRDFTVNSRGGTDRQVGWRVDVDAPGGYIKEWLKASREWGEPLHMLCSLYTEIETLIALKEWVVKRALPYLPLMAPNRFELGQLQYPEEGSLRADILLCCLLPSRNEIIPVQVKNSVTGAIRADYHREVVLVGTHELGTQTTSPQVVEVGGRRKTGVRISYTYGRILQHYLTVRGGSGHKSGRTPTKMEKRDYDEMLKPAFRYFDYEIGGRMNAYQSMGGQLSDSPPPDDFAV